jgi:hypothetical protein
VQHGCAIGQRRFDIEHGWQVLVLDLDQPRGGLGSLARFRRHRGDAIADHANSVSGQDRPIQQPPAETNVARFGAGQHRVHAERLSGSARIDRDETGMRTGAARIRQPQHARHADVGSVAGSASHLQRSVDSILGCIEDHAASLRRARSVHTRAILRL